MTTLPSLSSGCTTYATIGVARRQAGQEVLVQALDLTVVHDRIGLVADVDEDLRVG